MSERKHAETSWLQHIRTVEINSFSRLLGDASGKQLLEIGGGDGFLAEHLSLLGFSVISIDVAPRTPQLFEVRKCRTDGLDFPDNTFDIVFSCHVIAHVKDKSQAFLEISRVLKPDGIAVHIVPTTWWSLLTNAWHFLLLPGLILGPGSKGIPAIAGGQAECSFESQKLPQAKGSSKLEQRIRWMFLNPLGEHPSFLHEIIFFSRWYWMELFRRNGFEVLAVKGGPITQSGYRTLPFTGLGLRKWLATLFPSSVCFVTRRASTKS